MSSDQEIEIWGVLGKSDFEKRLKSLTSKMGKPKLQKRLSIQILNPDDKTLWTRIRITDGNAVIMQKVADWDAVEREEIAVEIASDIESIYKHYLILKNLLANKRCQLVMMQHLNYIFTTDEYEIKLSKQIGKNYKYPFEIEAIRPDVDLMDVAKAYNLKPDLSDKGEEFWNKWNDEVNLDLQEMQESEIKNIIKEYL